jgi:RNA polymerase sigma factor (sigma-70 family)
VVSQLPEAGQIEGEGFDDAFERLFLRAYRVSFQILRSREDAEDVAMDTMARVLRDWQKLDGAADAWVAKVATHRAIDLWRRAQRRRAHQGLARLDGSSRSTDEDLVLREAILVLPKRQREVVALRYFLDLSEQEIATMLGCSTGSVKQHASRGIAALRRQLHDQDLGEIGDV